MKYLLALDQGTSSTRAFVFDALGRAVSRAQRALPQSYPHPGWVEHDPDRILRDQKRVARAAVRAAGIAPEAIAAIGIANQRETTVAWDRRTGRALHPAIVWQDRRTADLCERLRREGHSEEIRSRTGLELDPYFSGTKLHWLLENVSGTRGLAEEGHLAFGTVDTWLLFHLSENRLHATDPSNASRTLLWNLRGEWDPAMLDLLRIPAPVLPEVLPTSGLFARTAKGILGREVPIMALCGDQQAALFGQACFRPGMAKTTYGTGCFLLLNTGSDPAQSRHRLLTTAAWQVGDRMEYALEGSVFAGGSVVQWLRDGLGILRRSADVEPLAGSVPDTRGVYLVPAFSGLGAPHWDARARGTLVGITRETSAAHVARAALESIAFQVEDLAEAMAGDCGAPLREMRVDGGAARNNLLMQMQADLLQVPVVRPQEVETTALGAAFLAGLAAGVWSGMEELETLWRRDRVFQPAITAAEAAERRARWREAVRRALDWARE